LVFVALWAKESWAAASWWGDLNFAFVASFFVSGMTQYTFGDGENLFLIMGIWAVFSSTLKSENR
jgi:O-antigen ligase